MKENSDILRLRVLLAFLNDDEPCTVMSIARTLKEEHYTISRVISSLEKEGLINRKAPRRPELTEAGKREALFYQERIYTTMNHLLYEGDNMESAKNDSYFWALYNTEDTMKVIRSADEKCRIKYELRDKRQFGGSLLCRNMKDGEYKFPFIIYREYAKNGDSISMANDGFEHPCTLSVIRGNGTILLKAVDMNARSGYDGKLMKGRIKGMKYFDNGRYISSDRNGNLLSVPASALTFKNMGEGMGQIFHGVVSLKMNCSAGPIHMPESTAIFTILI